MLGFCPYSEITHFGQTMGVKLTQPLEKDSAYCYGFWLKNSKNQNLDYIMREFNVAFVVDTAGIDNANDVPYYETIQNVNDLDWHYLSDYYIAKGGEEFLLFGNFDPTPNYYLEIPQTQGKYMYYFFDDFSLEPCSKDSLLSVVLELPNVLTLNNDHINEVYSLRLNNISKLEVQVLNRWGNVVREYDGITEVWDGKDRHDEPLTEGIYFVKAVGETTFGDVIQKTQFVTLVRP